MTQPLNLKHDVPVSKVAFKWVNLYPLPLGATIIGLQATTGLLFAKSLTAAAASPFTPGGASPVIALDIFLLQAGSNVMFAHWIGAGIALWLLRTINLPTPAQN